MNKILKNTWIILALGLVGCFEEEVYSDTPEIEFIDVSYIDNPNVTDTLELIFEFKDGGSDLGIDGEEDIFFPYNQFLVFLNEEDSLITWDNIDDQAGPIYIAQLVTSNVSLLVSGGEIFYDIGGNNHPVLAFEKQLYTEDISELSYSCPNIYNQEGIVYGSGTNISLDVYTIEDGGLFVETFKLNEELVVIPVESYYNLFIEFEENVGGEYQRVDFNEIFQNGDCLLGNFNGRIPWFDRDGKNGIIKYAMQSIGFSVAFQNPTRIKFYVIDRKGNQSNIAFSDDFFLDDITQ